MKKILTVILTLCMCMAISVLLSACNFGSDEHACLFKTEWEYDETYHWNECGDDTCSKTSSKERHDFDTSGSCQICGAYFSTQISMDGWTDMFSCLNTYNFSLVITPHNNTTSTLKTIEKIGLNYHCVDMSNEYYLTNENENYYKYLFDNAEWVKSSISKSEYIEMKDIVDTHIAYCTHLYDDFELFEYDTALTCYKSKPKTYGLENGNYVYNSSYSIYISDSSLEHIDGLIYLGEKCEDSDKIEFSIKFNVADFEIPLIPTTGLSYELCDTYYKLTGRGTAIDTHIVVPSTYKGLNVSAVADNAFEGDAIIEKLTLSDTITHIGNEAFSDCDNINYIKLGKGVAEIGNGAFARYDNRYTLIMYDNVKKIGNYAFGWGCSYVIKGDFYFYGDINKYAMIEIDSTRGRGFLSNHNFYYNDEKLTDLVIDTATYISDYTFESCSLRSVDIGSQVKSIGKDALGGTFSDEPFDIYYQGDLSQFLQLERQENWAYSYGGYNLYLNGELLRELDFSELDISKLPYEFSRCSSLEHVILPNTLTELNGEFYGCNNLKSVVFEEGSELETIGDDTFNSCYSLASFTMPTGVTYIGDRAFACCNSLTNIEIPLGVGHIGKWAFCDCGFTNVTLPNGIETISYSAFGGCDSLISIVIPKSVVKIEQFAFDNCPNLKTVFYGEVQEEWLKISVEDCNDVLTSTKIYYYTETEPMTNGNFWHYVNGVPVVWNVE